MLAWVKRLFRKPAEAAGRIPNDGRRRMAATESLDALMARKTALERRLEQQERQGAKWLRRLERGYGDMSVADIKASYQAVLARHEQFVDEHRRVSDEIGGRSKVEDGRA